MRKKPDLSKLQGSTDNTSLQRLYLEVLNRLNIRDQSFGLSIEEQHLKSALIDVCYWSKQDR